MVNQRLNDSGRPPQRVGRYPTMWIVAGYPLSVQSRGLTVKVGLGRRLVEEADQSEAAQSAGPPREPDFKIGCNPEVIGRELSSRLKPVSEIHEPRLSSFGSSPSLSSRFHERCRQVYTDGYSRLRDS